MAGIRYKFIWLSKLFLHTLNQGVSNSCRLNNSKTAEISRKEFHDGHDYKLPYGSNSYSLLLNFVSNLENMHL